MKMKYLAIMITAMAVSALFLSSSAHAQVPATVNIYAWTDKAYYNLGEKGTLKIVIRNDKTDQDLILQNITIIYPWFAYLGDRWDGNTTIIPPLPFVLLKNGGLVYNATVEFTVPTDGRAAGGEILIRVAVDKPPYYYPTTYGGYYPVTIYTKGVPTYTLPEGMDKIVTLFTIQTVLIIVCTIIIAATIFLSARRPQAMLKAEEKTG